MIPLASLYEHGEQQDSCFDCILYYLTSGETLAYGQSACTTDIRQPFAFTGQTTAMLLSHYPLSNQQTLVLPSTGWRRAVLYAQVQLEDQAIDFYCGGLTSPLNDVRLPYTGNYGKDGTTNLPDGGEQVENGWEDEQGVQVARLVAFIQQTSGSTGRPAILAGDWQSTLGVTDPGGNVVLGDLSRASRALSIAPSPAPSRPDTFRGAPGTATHPPTVHAYDRRRRRGVRARPDPRTDQGCAPSEARAWRAGRVPSHTASPSPRTAFTWLRSSRSSGRLRVREGWRARDAAFAPSRRRSRARGT